MSIQTINFLKSRFESGDAPTSADFSDLIDSTYSAGYSALYNQVQVNSAVWASSGGNPTYATEANNHLNLTLNLNIPIHKLSGYDSVNYIVNNGVEGQIIYLVPASNGNLSGVNITFSNARFNNGTGIISTQSNYSITLYQGEHSHSGAIATIIFTDGCWNIPDDHVP